MDRSVRIFLVGRRMVVFDRGDMNGIVVMNNRIMPPRNGDDTEQRNNGEEDAEKC